MTTLPLSSKILASISCVHSGQSDRVCLGQAFRERRDGRARIGSFGLYYLELRHDPPFYGRARGHEPESELKCEIPGSVRRIWAVERRRVKLAGLRARLVIAIDALTQAARRRSGPRSLAGAINSVAGGGTLISFPTLIWLGLNSVTANATSTVAIWPGTVGSMWGYRRELEQAEPRFRILIVPSLIGGLIGALLLRWTSPATFDRGARS